MSLGKSEITKLENEDGQAKINREEILRLLENVYKSLYSNQGKTAWSENIPHIINQGSEEMPKVTKDEILRALSETKYNK